MLYLRVDTHFMWDERQHPFHNTCTVCSVRLPIPRSSVCGGDRLVYSRTFGPKRRLCVPCNYVSFPYTVRLLCAIFRGQHWEYKRPQRPKINAQYQLSFLRLTRFRTPDKSIQNVWRRGCCFGCWQWCVSLCDPDWRRRPTRQFVDLLDLIHHSEDYYQWPTTWILTCISESQWQMEEQYSCIASKEE